ncbi:MAG: hypothetical protein PHY16_18625 [Methylobacter sp.]|nr:hypothetical protein [Methylobacter sp.]
MLGKKVLNNIYWHISLTNAQTEKVQQHIAEAESLAGLQAGADYNIVKYEIKGEGLSFLWYPGFFNDPLSINIQKFPPINTEKFPGG